MKAVKLQLVVLMLALWAAQAVSAATITVTSTADDGSTGTLRAALASAVDGDTIAFALTTPATIALTGRLVVDKSVTIAGPGRESLTVDGEQVDTVFHIYQDKTVTISGLTIANGFANESSGGGVVNAGTLTLRDCTLRDNSATYRGGGVENLDHTTLTIIGCTLSGNKVLYSGTDKSTGGGAIAIYSNRWYSPATVTIESSTLTENTAVRFGGAIFSNATAMEGAKTILTVTNSTLSGNSVSGRPNASGGGIYVWASGSGAIAFVTVENSTLGGNSVSGSTTASGGGIACQTVSSAYASLTVKNSTLSGNSATTTTVPGVGYGGAIATQGNGWLTVDNSTLNGNWDGGQAGGIWSEMDQGGSAKPSSIKNTILKAGPSGANLYNAGGTFQSYGYNLSSDDGGGLLADPTDRIDIDPVLGPLADNGGPTFTHALLAGSPAIDAGSSTDSAGTTVTADQRGVARPQGGGYDIGAFELVFSWSGVLPPVNADGTSVFKAGSTVPVKFRLTGGSAGITDLAATVSYARISNGVTGSDVEAVSTAAATTGSLFRYDSTAGQYIYNWSTKRLSSGTYRLFIDLGDGATRTVDLGLK